MKPKKITYAGRTMCIAEWAKHYGVNHVSFARWWRDFGMDGAVTLSGMDDAERRLWRRQQRRQVNGSGGWFSDIPKKDKDLEWKNRIRSWIRMGMTKEEMIIKARLSNETS